MTSKSENQIELLASIRRMVELLNISKQDQWTRALNSALKDPEIRQNIERFILSLYGGVGSLNDVVLYVNGEADLDINNEFDALRTEIFDFCLKGIQDI